MNVTSGNEKLSQRLMIVIYYRAYPSIKKKKEHVLIASLLKTNMKRKTETELATKNLKLV